MVSYQSERFSSKWELPFLPPSSLELWRKERARKAALILMKISHFDRTLRYYMINLTFWNHRVITQICPWHNRLYLRTYKSYIKFERLCWTAWYLVLIWYLLDICSIKITLVILNQVSLIRFQKWRFSAKYDYHSLFCRQSLFLKSDQIYFI